MAIPSWHDIAEDAILSVDELRFALSHSDYTFSNYDSYWYIGHKHITTGNKWDICIPGYDSSYPDPHIIYVKQHPLYEGTFVASATPDFSDHGYPVGYLDSSLCYKLIKNTDGEADIKPYGLDRFWAEGGVGFTIKDFSKLYLRNGGANTPKIIWVEEMEGEEPTFTEIPYSDDPPEPPDPPIPPVLTTYRAVAYLRGNKTYNSLSMIHRAFINNGESVSHQPLSNIERFVNGTELNAIGRQMVVGSTRIVCYSDDDNYFTITKVSEEDTLGGRQWVYDIDFYIDDELVSALQQEYVITGDEKMYISFISDEYNELARPSFIHKYSDEYCEYNIETVSVANLSLYYEWLGNSDKNYDIPDPYQGGGDSTEEITPGNFVRQNDDTDFPTELSINPKPFFNVYLPDDGLDYQGELFQLESFLWGGLFDEGSLKKIFTNPIDTIISLHLIPLNLVSTLEDEEVMLGNVNSGIEMTPLEDRFVYVDCGSIDINEYYSSYLDYAPYTKMSVYLPYIGVVPVSTDDFMNKKMQIKYGVDVETGGLLCLIKSVDKHDVSQTLYSFSGNCALSIPVTAVKHDNLVNGIISGSVALFMGGATLATNGIAAAASSATFARSAGSLASSVVGSKPYSQRTSSLSGNVGYMGIQYPYLIIERPNQCHATAQNKYKGYPSHLTYQLSSLRGYTEIESIHLEGITCTDEELKELDGILKEGVIF